MKQSPDARETHSTRRSLLDAGRQLFATKGFKAASIRDIVALAGANLGAVTYHFGTKKALYHAVIEDITAPMRSRLLAPLPEEGTALDQFEGFLRANFAFLVGNPDLPRIVLHVLASDGKLPPPGREMIKLILNLAISLIEKGQADGSIRTGNAKHIALAAAGQPIFHGIYRSALRETIDIDPFDPATADRIVDDIVALIRAGLANTEKR